jgi:uncharacterized protein YdaU (DUF1376 family)
MSIIKYDLQSKHLLIKSRQVNQQTQKPSPTGDHLWKQNQGLRHKTKREVEGPTKWRDRRVKRWHDRRMRKEGCNLGNKKLITVRLAEHGKLQAKRKDHHESSTIRHVVSSRSNDKGNILR